MSAQRDKQKLADRPMGRATAFALSLEPKEGVMRTHMGPVERQQDHKVIFHPICLSVCLCVSALHSFFFFKLSAQKHTLALLTLAKYGLTGHSFDKNYTFQ